MIETDPLKTYPALVAKLREVFAGDAALEAAVGGDFLTVGKLEAALLRSLGLRGCERVVDVGCGSGRLALQLSPLPDLRYLGTDIVPDLLDHARKICARPDWRFVPTDGVQIPSEDGTADFVCFFSVFTHLTHEDTYRYLREARRVLKPGGKVVFSFLEFLVPSHWAVFRQSLDHGRPGDHLNQFVSRDGIAKWSLELGLRVDALHDGDQNHIPLEEPVVWSDGRVMEGSGALGQSVAVLTKPA